MPTIWLFVVTSEAFANAFTSRDRAMYIKNECDSNTTLNPGHSAAPWHCIVGKGFGCAISHASDFSVFFDFVPHDESILLFKALGAPVESST